MENNTAIKKSFDIQLKGFYDQYPVSFKERLLDVSLAQKIGMVATGLFLTCFSIFSYTASVAKSLSVPQIITKVILDQSLCFLLIYLKNRQSLKNFSAIFSTALCVNLIGSFFLFSFAPLAFFRTINVLKNLTLLSSVFTLGATILKKGKDHPDNVKKWEKRISEELANKKGLESIFKENPHLKEFILSNTPVSKNFKEIQEYLLNRLRENPLRTPQDVREIYAKEGEHALEFCPASHPLFHKLHFFNELLVKKQIASDTNQIHKPVSDLREASGIAYIDERIEEKKRQLKEAQKGKLLAICSGISGIFLTLFNLKKAPEIESKRSQSEDIDLCCHPKVLSREEQIRVNQIQLAIENPDCEFLATCGDSIKSLEREKNLILYGKLLTEDEFKELQKRTREISPVQTVFGILATMFGAQTYKNKKSQIDLLQKEIEELEMAKFEVRNQLESRFQAMEKDFIECRNRLEQNQNEMLA
jgi:hypothetical protein